MKLLASYTEDLRRVYGGWSIKVVDPSGINDLQTDQIWCGLVGDWFEINSTRTNEVLKFIIGLPINDAGPEPATAGGNEFAMIIQPGGVFVSHAWDESMMNERAGWYSWELVRVVAWMYECMRNYSSLNTTNHSMRIEVNVENWLGKGAPLRDFEGLPQF